MWIVLIIQGVIACVALVWFAVQDWPSHLLGSLLALPFPVIFVFGGVMMRHQQRELTPRRKAYLASNETAQREVKRARILKWVTLVLLVVGVFVFARMPPGYFDNPAVMWLVGGVLLLLIIVPSVYGALVQTKVDEAATRHHTGEAPPTPDERRKQMLWAAVAVGLVIAIVTFDQLVESPISAMTVFLYAVLIFVAAAFVWRKLNPPRDPK